MTDHEDLLRYYNGELEYLRQMGQRFARLYPQQARQLEWSSHGSADPHVERLLESFAFLTGRLQRSLDLEFPQITSGLLGVLYPHLVSPIPSMSIACFSGKNSEGKYQFGGVPRHSELLAQPGGGLNCRFRTCYDAVALPMEVSAGFASRNDYEFLDREARVFGVISLKIAPARGIKVTLAEMQKAVRNRLRFYLNGNTSLVQTVYELLFCHVLKVAVIGEDRAPVFLPSNSIRPVGFALDEEVIPYPTESHPGYRLIQEYFALPEKFLFFDLMNLDSADRPMAGKEVEVLFLLDQAPPPGTYLAPDTFLTGCTPIINLFQTTTDPIRLDHRKSEYRLVADVRRERTMEIHSIQSVSASRDPRFENTTIPPYYSFQHGREASAFWHSRRTFALGDMPGTDIYLSFLDLHFRNSVPPVQTVYAHVLCTNRELARELDEQTELKMEKTPHSARMLMKPTLPASPPLEGPTTWALVSNLALNYLSFSSGRESLQALKEMLRLYSFADRTATLQKVDWIHDMNCRHIAHRMPGDAWRGFCRGTEVSLVFDDNAHLGSGAFLLASVLQRFFGLYASINSFVKMVIRRRSQHDKDELWKEWEPVGGDQKLL